MMHNVFPMDAFEVLFLALQAFIVIFLLVHDWIPLGRLNNNAAKSREDKHSSLVFSTLLAAVPSAIGLYYSAKYFLRPYPHWLTMLLSITYGLFMLGMLRAWWIPYLLSPDAERATRYQSIFADTHSFLPVRNGIVPDTLHVMLHLATVATLIALFVRDRILTASF
jgi:hypothetical protein